LIGFAHPVGRLSSLDVAMLSAVPKSSDKRFSFYSKSFQIIGWYAHEKHKPALYSPSWLDLAKTGIDDASEALDPWPDSVRSLIELGLPEE
jgi:hypothetical protein